MRILYLYDGQWPKGATRVRKETMALAAGGHEVNLVCRNAERAPARLHEPWMEVWRLPRIPGRALRYALNFPFFVSPVWLATIWRVLRRTRPQLLIAEDLPLAPCAIWFGQVFGIPVHYDMGEVYPEFLRSLRLLERQGPLKWLLRTPKAADRLEGYVLPRAAAVYVVSAESRERCERLGVEPERIVVVGNTPENVAELRNPQEPPPDVVDLVADQREILLFVGILIADRGVADAIRALPAIQARRPKAALVIVGDGTERKALEEVVHRMELGAAVRFVGWKLPENLPAYYQASQIGLLPFRDSPHVRLTLANKLFDYMAAGLPVLGSDLPPTRRVLLETGAGRLHRPDDPGDLAQVAAGMLEDFHGRQTMGARGRAAVDTVYSWERDAARLQDAVLRLRQPPDRKALNPQVSRR